MQSPIDELTTYIAKSKFFSILSKEKISELLAQFQIIELNPDETLFNQGDASDHVYILTSGELVSFLTKPSGNTIIGTITPIQTIGELGALTGETRSLTVEAVSKAKLLKLPSSVFREFCDKYPEVLAEISQFIVQRSLETIKLMAHEKFSYNVSIVVPLVRNIPLDIIKARFRKHLEGYNTVFLSCNEVDPEELKKLIKNALDEKKQIIIFMDVWQESIYKYCFQQLNHLYLLVSTNQYDNITHQITQILHQTYLSNDLRIELILLHPDSISDNMNTRQWLELANFDLHHQLRLNNDADFSRLIRFMTGNAFTLVLGGGGAKGYVHLGVLKALIDRKIPIDAIGGTSAGANIGACYAFTQQLSETMEYVDRTRIAAFKAIKMRNLTWPLVSLFSSDPATHELTVLFKNECIEDLWIPYFAISANLTDKMQKVHRTGFIWEAVRTSASLPGIFPPVIFNGKMHFDGGLLNNLPVDVMRDIIGPGHMIMAVSLSQKAKELDTYNFPPVLTRTQTILSRLGWGYKDYHFPYFPEIFMNALLLGSSALEEKNCTSADLLIKPDLTSLGWLTKKGDLLMEMGYHAAIEAIDKFLKLHPHYRRN